jgi:hypothetical protein
MVMREDIDKAIAEALSEEERMLLERHGEDHRLFAQATGALRGPMAGIMWVISVTQAVMFFAGVYFAWRFFAETDVLAALRLGLSAAVLLILALILKSVLGTHGEVNRVIREIKRLELQVALLKAKLDG